MKRILTLTLLITFFALPAVAQKQSKKKSTAPTPAASAAVTKAVTARYNALLTGLGSIASGHLYFAYWALNTLADNTEKNLYNSASAKNLAVTYHNIIQKAMYALIDVRNTSVDTTDRAFLTKMLYAYNDIDSSARTLVHFYDTKDSSSFKTFHTIHAIAWNKITDLFNLAPKQTTPEAVKKEKK